MAWNKNETNGFYFFRDTYDPDAKKLGGSNSQTSDIWSPRFNCMIEAKQNKAQYGQFTRGTADRNPFSSYIMSKLREDVTPMDAKLWCLMHQKLRNVGYMLIIHPEPFDCTLYPVDEWFEKNTFKLENRTTKKSGSRDLPKFAYKLIPKEWDIYYVNGIPHSDNIDAKFMYPNKKGEMFTMWVSDKKEESTYKNIRTLSRTKNETWIFTIV